MAWRRKPTIGLSVGATNLAAVTADSAVTRRPVLTLYRHRQSEVGVPAENPNLNEHGLVITDFVDRVGDPAGIVATDGSMHHGQGLVADGLRSLAYAATGGRPLPEAVAVTHPTHWSPAAVDAVRGALRRVREWSYGPLLVSDAAAVLTALQANPGLPTSGVVAVCDFGGSGSSITLVDAANGYRPIGDTVRHPEFSGELVDQALLNHVLVELCADGSFDTSVASAIGSLARLRAECRDAKDRLSLSTATELRAELSGFTGDVQLTRADLDDAIRRPLETFVAVLQATLDRSAVSDDLVAVAAVGGGANVPGIATRLSQQFRVPVITTPQPQLTAALGAALLAERGLAGSGQTALAPAVSGVAPAATPAMAGFPQVPDAPDGQPWSLPDDERDVAFVHTVPDDAGESPIRPQHFEQGASTDWKGRVWAAWKRRRVPVVVAAVVVVLAVGAGIALLLWRDLRGAPGPSPVPPAPASVSENPTATVTVTAPSSAVTQQPPPPETSAEPTTPEPTMPETTVPEPTLPETTVPGPTTTTAAPAAPTPPAPTTTISPPTLTTQPSTPSTSSPASEVPHIPHIPRFP